MVELDFIYVAGFITATVVFAAFAITTSARRHSILRNMFFLATLATLFLVVNMSVQTAKTGDWVVDKTTFNATDNSTTYGYTQVAPSVNPADLDNIFLILSAVIMLVFGYILIQMILNAMEWVMRSLHMIKKGEDEQEGT